ncbi:hypothetical protein BCV08_17740 [Vibrio breoganii]|uniref:restriction endonuclease subunit S n=1 Tax=Vibrio breoganii TaxID=553239 RepID=UPI000C816421|nr:restriction endonuclease subunit S [Vibrio breoganii]PMF73666.1 hypothetical protein BCV08_17740 [Vibrio breoganii]
MATDVKYPPSVKAGKPILDETPNGWVRESLKNHLNLEQRKVKVEDNKEYDLVTVKRSRGGVVRREHLLGKQISVKSQFTLKEGDFLISKRQIVHGACGIVPTHLNGSIVSNEYSIFTAKDSFDLTYLRYLSETLYFQQTCFHSSIGVHIEKMIFKLDNWFKWDFNLPPLPEQRKIAKILSTWDKAIATTEKLIETSKQQKKALMQQLLTGKKRLVNPETGKVFEGEWEEVHIGDICDVNPKKPLEPDNGLVSFIPMDAVSEDAKLLRKEVKSYLDVFKGFSSFRNFDTLIAKITPCFENGKGAQVRNLENGIGFGSTEFHVLRAKKGISPDFVYFITNTSAFRVRGEMNMQGSAGQKRVTTDYLKLYKTLVPKAYEEQEKIASVLTATDKEIQVQEAKLVYFEQEKKALMQQLLTGKRRVKVDDAEIV